MRQTSHRPKGIALGALFLACLAVDALQAQTTVTYTNFSSTVGLNLTNDATTATGYNGQKVLRLTPAAPSQGGAAWSTSSIAFSGAFSTFFQFQITNPGGLAPADGIVFVLQTVSAGAGSTGGLIGYGGISPSVGVEFDTYQNGWDPNDNHVGIDIDGGANDPGTLTSLVTATPYGVSNCLSPVGVTGCMANGHLWSVWIDYNAGVLNIALADNSTTRPANILSYNINIACVLAGGTVGGTGCSTPATTAFVGFTAGTGEGYENHDIVDWEYTNAFAPFSGLPTTPLPSTLLIVMIGLTAAAAYQERDRLVAWIRRGSR
jgi:hypothetical protein